MADYDYMLWGKHLAAADVPFFAGLQYADPVEFVNLLATESLEGTGLSQSAFVTMVTDLITGLSANTITLAQSRPDLIINALLTHWDGSQLTEAVSSTAFASFYTTLEAIYDADHTKFLTTAAMAQFRVDVPLNPTEVSQRIMIGSWSSLENTDNDYKQNPVGNWIVQSDVPGSVSQASLPNRFGNIGFGSLADYGLGEYGQLPDPKQLVADMALLPAGNKIAFAWYLEPRAVYQELKLTSSGSPSGNFTIKFKPDGGSYGSPSGNIPAGDPVVSTLAETDVDGNETVAAASQMQIKVLAALNALSDFSFPCSVFWQVDKVDKSEMSMRVHFHDPAKIGGTWDYPSTTIVETADATTGFEFVAVAGATLAKIKRNDGKSWSVQGWAADQGIRAENATDAANNACYLVSSADSAVDGYLHIKKREATSSTGGATLTYIQANLPDDVTARTDKTVTFRSTGFGVPTYFHPECSIQNLITVQGVGLVNITNTPITPTQETANTGGGNHQDFDRYDYLENDKSAKTYGGGRSVKHFKLENSRAWILHVMTAWWREFKDLGGKVDWVVANYENFMTAPGWIDSGSAKPETATGSQIWGIMGDKFSPGQGSHAEAEFWKAWVLTNTWATYWAPHLSTAEKALYTAGTHPSRYANSLAGKRQSGREFQRVISLMAEFCKAGLYDAPFAAGFTDVDGSNWKFNANSGSTPRDINARKIHGTGAIGGNLQMEEMYHGHSNTVNTQYTPQHVAQLNEIGDMPVGDSPRMSYPASEVKIEKIERATDGKVTVTIFPHLTIEGESAALYPSRYGNNQGFNGVVVGHWVTGIVNNHGPNATAMKEFVDVGFTALHRPTNSGVSILNPGQVTRVGTPVDGAVRDITFSTGLARDWFAGGVQAIGRPGKDYFIEGMQLQDPARVTEKTLAVSSKTNSARVQIVSTWQRLVGNARRMRNMHISCRNGFAVWPQDHVDRFLNELDAEFIFLAAMCGCTRFQQYNVRADDWLTGGIFLANPGDPVNSRLLHEDMIQAALVHLNTVAPYKLYPLGVNFTSIEIRAEHVVGGALMSNGSFLFRTVLRPADDGAPTTAPTTPGIFQTFGDRVQFITRNAETIDVPGRLIVSSEFNTFGFWTLVSAGGVGGLSARGRRRARSRPTSRKRKTKIRDRRRKGLRREGRRRLG